ncbi:MAG: sulfate transporter, periplasmic sulfate-binding protein [Gemmataceae bacterium]|nr:sulfate transporter, periplasmic sulfate-binding protein [Gemmataceae bacterium]
MAKGEIQPDVVALGTGTDLSPLQKANLIPADWRYRLPHRASPFSTFIVFVVPKGNPKGVKDWPDLAKEGVRVLNTNPKGSRTGRHSFLAAYGSVRQRGGSEDEARAFVTTLYQRAKLPAPVIRPAGEPAPAEAPAFLPTEPGDVLLNWEKESLDVVKKSDGKLEIVYPPISIRGENPVAVASNAAAKGTGKTAEASAKFLYSDEVQELAAPARIPAGPPGGAPEGPSGRPGGGAVRRPRPVPGRGPRARGPVRRGRRVRADPREGEVTGRPNHNPRTPDPPRDENLAPFGRHPRRPARAARRRPEPVRSGRGRPARLGGVPRRLGRPRKGPGPNGEGVQLGVRPGQPRADVPVPARRPDGRGGVPRPADRPVRRAVHRPVRPRVRLLGGREQRLPRRHPGQAGRVRHPVVRRADRVSGGPTRGLAIGNFARGRPSG